MSNYHIHPSAIIEKDVYLGYGCVIGPDVIIESWACIGPHAVIGGMPEHKAFYDDMSGIRTKGVRIRHGARIFEYVTVHAGTIRPTEIQQDAAVFNHSHIAHDVVLGVGATVGGHASIAGHVVVMEHAIISGKSSVHQWCVVGPYAFLGGWSYLTAHIPPGEKWMGNPARPCGMNDVGLARAGLLPWNQPWSFEEQYVTRIEESKLVTRKI